MTTHEEVARGSKGRGTKNGGGRGSVRNEDRLSIFADRSGGGEADWGNCDPKWMLAVVVKITLLGGAVTFGLSRDQGAHSLTLLLDQGRQTLWFNGGADLDNELEGVLAVLDAM